MSFPVILVAEDNEDDYLLLQRAIRNAMFKSPIHHVDDGEKAILYLSGEPPYCDRSQYPVPMLVLLDLKLPRKSGFEVMEWVRSQQGLRRLPIVILTSSDQDKDIRRAYDLGANSYLVKPGSFEQLVKLTQMIESYWLSSNKYPDLKP